MTIDAVLQRLVLSSPQPEQVAGFYEHAFGYRAGRDRGEWRCEGPERSLWIRSGAANQLLESHFAFREAGRLERYVAELESRGVAHEFKRGSTAPHLKVRDPNGRIVFFFAGSTDPLPRDRGSESPGPARLQHYAVRTPEPQKLVDFYVQALGFAVSDLVRDDVGDLTAAFLRTDSEHHSLAIFRSPQARFDHFSCETRDWTALRDWADHMAARSVMLAWGIGRHGPGNDTSSWSTIRTATWPRSPPIWRFAPPTVRRVVGSIAWRRSISGAWPSCAVEIEQSSAGRHDQG